MSILLKAASLTKVFNDENGKTTILNNIDLSIESGEFTVIMGQSGSGKSTLLYNISGMDKMTSGEVNFDGEQFSQISDEKMSFNRLSKMGFIFQNSYLLKNLSIEDNILLPGLKLKKLSKNDTFQKAQRLMHEMGIEAIAKHDTTKVSGGQLQRAAICRALINDPKILFCDEPTGALNSSSTENVMDLLNIINSKGTAVLAVTHDARVAARADRIIYLSDGNIRSQCSLGKYNSNTRKEREEKVLEFLKESGF